MRRFSKRSKKAAKGAMAETSPMQVHGLIAQCLQAFERGDWLGLADILEFEIAQGY